jgi:hypothetical protein
MILALIRVFKTQNKLFCFITSSLIARTLLSKGQVIEIYIEIVSFKVNFGYICIYVVRNIFVSLFSNETKTFFYQDHVYVKLVWGYMTSLSPTTSH